MGIDGAIQPEADRADPGRILARYLNSILSVLVSNMFGLYVQQKLLDRSQNSLVFLNVMDSMHG
jgi:hypothetical protein